MWSFIISLGITIFIGWFFWYAFRSSDKYWEAVFKDIEETPLRLQKEWDIDSADYKYVLYKYGAWEDGWSISFGWKELGRGDKEWAEKQKKYYDI